MPGLRSLYTPILIYETGNIVYTIVSLRERPVKQAETVNSKGFREKFSFFEKEIF